MLIKGVKTKKIVVGDDLFDILDEFFLAERSGGGQFSSRMLEQNRIIPQ